MDLASQLGEAPIQSLPPRLPPPVPREKIKLPHADGTIATDKLPNPNEPVMTRSQRHMLHEFKKVGRVGLAAAIYAIGKKINEESGGHAMKDLLEDGGDDGNSYVIQLLETLPDMIIESLIKCTLPYNYHNTLDAEFMEFVRDEMQPTATPGIYANFPCFSAKSTRPGMCLTGKRMRVVLDKANTYFHAMSKDQNEVDAIDHFFKAPTEGVDDGTQGLASIKKQWGDSDGERATFDEWYTRMEYLYLDDLPEADQDKNFLHCAVECGWGNDVKERAAAHPANKGTTYLFAVYNVLTRKEGYGEMMQLMIFPIWKRDRMLAKIAEITASILCSSLWTEGGLNSAFPGNMPEPNASEFSFRRNAETLVRRQKKYGHLNHDEQILETVERLKNAHIRAEWAERRYNIAEAEYQKLARAAEKELQLREELAKIERDKNELLLKKGKAIDASRQTGDSTSSTSDPTFDAFEASMKELAEYNKEKTRQREARRRAQ